MPRSSFKHSINLLRKKANFPLSKWIKSFCSQSQTNYEKLLIIVFLGERISEAVQTSTDIILAMAFNFFWALHFSWYLNSDCQLHSTVFKFSWAQFCSALYLYLSSWLHCSVLWVKHLKNISCLLHCSARFTVQGNLFEAPVLFECSTVWIALTCCAKANMRLKSSTLAIHI